MRRDHAPPRRRRPVPGCSEFTAFACSRSVAPSLLFLCFSHHGRRQCTQSTEPIDAPRELVSVVHTESKHRAHAATPIPPPKPPSPPSSSLSRPMSRRVEHASRTRASASLGQTPPPPSRHLPSRFLLSTSASTPRRRLRLRPAEPPPRSPPRRAERGSRGRRCRAGIRQARGALFHLAAFPPPPRQPPSLSPRRPRLALSCSGARAWEREGESERTRKKSRETEEKKRDTVRWDLRLRLFTMYAGSVGSQGFSTPLPRFPHARFFKKLNDIFFKNVSIRELFKNIILIYFLF